MISGTSLEVGGNIRFRSSQVPSVVDCPVWLDKLIMQLLEKDDDRPHGAPAVNLALQVRRNTISHRCGEHVSPGFSPLNVVIRKTAMKPESCWVTGVAG